MQLAVFALVTASLNGQARPWWLSSEAPSLAIGMMKPRSTVVVAAIVIGALMGVAAGSLLALSRHQHSIESPVFKKSRDQPRASGLG
jgi:predicted membrane-bound mannosyltransferase